MKLLRPDQVSGMNIHYKFYSLEYFLESQMRAGFKTISPEAVWIRRLTRLLELVDAQNGCSFLVSR